MKVHIYPSRAAGTMRVPPSKSMAHRWLILAALSGGSSVIRGVEDSEDLLATMNCLKALGALIRKEGSTVYLEGIRIREAKPLRELSCRESGSTLRFLLPAALLCGQEVCLTGADSLLARPLEIYEQMCLEKGMSYRKEKGCIFIRGPLVSGTYSFPGNVSSQFATGLLMALPQCQGDSLLKLLPPVESFPYIQMTLRTLERSGIIIKETEPFTYRIPGGQSYLPVDVTVEGDWSAAACFGALNAAGGHVKLSGLEEDSAQGDKIFETLIKTIEEGKAVIDISHIPDLGPILAAVAALEKGAVLTGTARLALKESHRGEALAREIGKLGKQILMEENRILIPEGRLQAPREELEGHNDHRIVMALALMASVTGGTIRGAEAVNKSMPDFFERLQQLGVKLTIE
ncbi:MAG: 3-phosphoshikimate 1-carboxyvinyltransferase [Lachnospiraceae bacterium]|nr:3-phosphoshikimate 1-carboxyvinyltransferase [Lachnospiraceae bacterium]